METFFQDIRYGARTLLKSRGFTMVAVITLALGIGANTAIFSAMNAVLLRAFPLADPGKLVMVWESNPKIEGFLGERLPVRLATFLRWTSDARSFTDLGAFSSLSYNVSGKEKTEHVDAAQASPNFFNVLGVKANLGRTFLPQDGTPGNDRLVVLSQPMYQRHFGNETDLSGKTLRLNGVEYAVIGVLPEQFHLPATWEGMDQKKADVWTPLNVLPSQSETELQANRMVVIARLRPGVSVEKARAEVQVIGQRLTQQDPKNYEGFGANLFSIYTEDVSKPLRRSLVVLQLAVCFVLLIACANVANLLLARATSREREIAVRIAMGAGSKRIVRQMLSESLLLSFLGGAAGWLLAYWGVHALTAMAPADIHGLHEVKLDGYVLAFTLAIVTVTGILFGSAPAWHALKQDVNESLTRGARPGSKAGSNRLRNLLVISEFSLALVLLVGGGLMLRSLRALTAVDLGFRAEQIVSGRITLSPAKYQNDAQKLAFCNQVLERVRALPAVKSAALTSGLPMEDISMTSFRAEGQEGEMKHQQAVDYQSVSDAYFDAMASPLLRGRDFTPQEAEQGRNVIVVNHSFAERLWPGQDAIGKFVVLHAGGKSERKLIVTGVAPDTHQLGPDAPSRAEVYIPQLAFEDVRIVIRTHADPAQVSRALSDVVAGIDKDQPVYQVEPFSKVVRESTSEPRFLTVLLGIFSLLALVLAGIGIYGVLAYVVSQRTSEIGIRMALGAQLNDVLRLVLSQGCRLMLVGVGVGIAAAFVLTRLMTGLLFQVKAYDPRTFIVVALLLGLVAMLASYIPARRATKVDPIVALRQE